MRASLYAGLAFSNAGLGLVHAMAHALGGYLDIPHGESNTILINRVIEFNFAAAPERYVALGEALGVPMREFEPFRKTRRALRIARAAEKDAEGRQALGRFGVSARNDCPSWLQMPFKDPCVATNPRRPTQKEIEDTL